jgi:hypothetical protein
MYHVLSNTLVRNDTSLGPSLNMRIIMLKLTQLYVCFYVYLFNDAFSVTKTLQRRMRG